MTSYIWWYGQSMLPLIIMLNSRNFLPLFFFFFGLFSTAPAAHGGSQARGQIGAVAASLHHSHHNTRSELCLLPTPQFIATLYP